MKVVVLFLLVAFVGASPSFADDDAKGQLIKGLNNQIYCDGADVTKALKSVKLDEDTGYLGLIHGCKIAQSLVATLSAPQLFQVSQKIWDYWSQDYYPNSKQMPAQIDAKQFFNVSSALGFSVGVASDLCKKNIAGACALSDKIKPVAETQANELNKIANAYTVSNRCNGAAAGDAACLEYQHKKMTQRLTNPKGDWAGHDPYDYRLIQLVDGYEVFASASSVDLIAIRQKSVHNVEHPTPAQGDNLPGVLGTLVCTKFISEGDVKNQSGFSVHVYRYDATPCPTR